MCQTESAEIITAICGSVTKESLHITESCIGFSVVLCMLAVLCSLDKIRTSRENVRWGEDHWAWQYNVKSKWWNRNTDPISNILFSLILYRVNYFMVCWLIITHSYIDDIDNNCTVESRLSSPTGLDLGLIPARVLETPKGLDAPSAAMVAAVQGAPSPLALFSNFILTVCRLRADGGGRSPRSFKNKLTLSKIFCNAP